MKFNKYGIAKIHKPFSKTIWRTLASCRIMVTKSELYKAYGERHES